MQFQLEFVLAGAEEACWAHNPKVQGSKPWRAIWLAAPLRCASGSSRGQVGVKSYESAVELHTSLCSFPHTLNAKYYAISSWSMSSVSLVTGERGSIMAWMSSLCAIVGIRPLVCHQAIQVLCPKAVHVISHCPLEINPLPLTKPSNPSALSSATMPPTMAVGDAIFGFYAQKCSRDVLDRVSEAHLWLKRRCPS
ncbi:hypothetical protein THAOC_32519 [Thalassiosira oceanica]|uniref:Uncharacterized protein n=1 Tax=Thalassiosira oceanica TaxID=159749 RepID=K0R939_THAOC|nr:hypothetical protein THAOC_32519 [Thalassiosira oceanica]|eukprot:EJK48664.1 hypothetical protein THAOC_32519 [Thalassiosira oceanica]